MKPVFIHFNRETQKYVVSTVEYYGWFPLDTKWMADDLIGNFAHIPTIDVITEQFVFDDEQAALTKVAQLYSEQLK